MNILSLYKMHTIKEFFEILYLKFFGENDLDPDKVSRYLTDLGFKMTDCTFYGYERSSCILTGVRLSSETTDCRKNYIDMFYHLCFFRTYGSKKIIETESCYDFRITNMKQFTIMIDRFLNNYQQYKKKIIQEKIQNIFKEEEE